jgi:hypothetical protein
VFLGVDIPVDKAPPIIGLVEQIRIDTVGSDVTVHARVHDNKSPPMPHDLNEVSVVWSLGSGPEQTAAMNWYGEYLWRATLTDIPGTSIQYRVCAMDLQGNRACSDTFESDS